MISSTSKTLAFISYNSLDFLTSKLNLKIEQGVISFYTFIYHLGENDEAGSKNHIHLLVEPLGRLDIPLFQKDFNETDPNNEKPLAITQPRICNSFSDWYLYALHDKEYLLAKNLERKYFYNASQFVTSDSDTLHYLSYNSRNDCKSLVSYHNTMDIIYNSAHPIELVKTGKITISNINQYNALIHLVNYTGNYDAPTKIHNDAKNDGSYIEIDNLEVFENVK